MSEYSIVLDNVCKTFRVYHEKRNSVYETLSGLFNKKKYYEDLPVLKNISFSVKKGEMFGIIGKNGTGKTTLLRIISGIYKPDSGSVIVNGSLIPFLSLGAGFNPEMTATDNVIQYGMVLGFSKKAIMERVDEIMKFSELEKFSDTKLKNFSSGMFARLAFSTAIQVDPDVLIIDEALAVGDLAFHKKSFDTILSFKNRGKSIILVTHDMNTVRNYCDNVIFLNNGNIVSMGPANDVV